MYEVITAVQVGSERQCQLSDGTIRALKWLLLSFPNKENDPVSLKNLLEGDKYWTCVKEVLGWTFNTEAGTVDLPDRKRIHLLCLLYILATRRFICQKYIEFPIGKLYYKHLSVPGVIAHIYHIQCALARGGGDRDCLYLAFHHKIMNWRAMVK